MATKSGRVDVNGFGNLSTSSSVDAIGSAAVRTIISPVKNGVEEQNAELNKAVNNAIKVAAVAEIFKRDPGEAARSRNYQRTEGSGPSSYAEKMLGTSGAEKAFADYANGGHVFTSGIAEDKSAAPLTRSDFVTKKGSNSIDVDPTGGVRLSAMVNTRSLSEAEKDSIAKSGSFDRDGIRYTASGSPRAYSNPSGASSEYVKLSTSFSGSEVGSLNGKSGSPEYMRASQALRIQKNGADVRMHSNASITAASVNNYRALGLSTVNYKGATFKPSSSFSIDEYSRLEAKAQNARASFNNAAQGNTKRQRAAAQSRVASSAVSKIKDSDPWLSKHFDGTNTAECIAFLEAKKTLLKAKGKSVDKVNSQIEALREFSAYGGTGISKSERESQKHRSRVARGKRALVYSVLPQDMRQGVMVFTVGAKVVKATAKAGRSVVQKTAFKSVDFSTKLVGKGLKAIKGDSPVTAALERANSKNKKAYERAKEKATARKNGNLREYRKKRRDEAFSRRGDSMQRRKGALEGRRAKAAPGSKAEAKIQRRLNTVNNRIDRHNRASEFRLNYSRGWIRRRVSASSVGTWLKNTKVFKAGKKVGSVLKTVGKVVSAPFTFAATITKYLKAIAKKLVFGVVIGYGIFLLTFVALAIGPMITFKIIGAVFDPNNFTLSNDSHVLLEVLKNSVNYNQVIANAVADDIATDLAVIAQIDATNHYINKKNVPSDGGLPWYKTPKLGMIDHIWTWEQADNVSRAATEADYESGESLWDDAGRLSNASGPLLFADPEKPSKENGLFVPGGNTYVPEKERKNLTSLTENLWPIMAMIQIRYGDHIDYESYSTALGYAYYMFAVSHDVAKYDTNALYESSSFGGEYGHDEDDPGYFYQIENPCPQSELYAGTFDKGPRLWEPEIMKAVTYQEVCPNVYLHDFATGEGHKNGVTSGLPDGLEWIRNHDPSELGRDGATTFSSIQHKGDGSIWDVISSAKEVFTKTTVNAVKNLVEHFVKKESDEEGLLDGIDLGCLDKGYTAMNCLYSIQVRKRSFKGVTRSEFAIDGKPEIQLTIQQLCAKHPDMLNVVSASGGGTLSGVFLYDGTDGSLPHGQSEFVDGEAPKDCEVNQLCSCVAFYPLGTCEDDVEKVGDSDTTRLIYGEDVYEGASIDPGCHDHSWQNGCFELKINKGIYTECPGYEHWHSAECWDEDGNLTCGLESHTHGADCYDLTEFICEHGKKYQSTNGHEEWKGESSPGCWKTVAVCQGHCGGHIQPMVNMVQKMTYWGLAYDDSFKTTHWLKPAEIMNSTGYKYGGMIGMIDALSEDNLATIPAFRTYWYKKSAKWFVPFPRSAFTFLCTAGEKAIEFYLEASDLAASYWNLVLGTDEIVCEKPVFDKETWKFHFHTLECFKSYEKYEFRKPEEEEEDFVDKEGFDGWWSENEINWYYYDGFGFIIGNWEENEGYPYAEENWDFAEYSLKIPKVGLSNRMYRYTVGEDGLESLDPQAFKSIVEQLKAKLDLTDPTQKKLWQTVLDRMNFTYSLNGHWSDPNGLKNYGSTDCTGWIIGNLSRLGVCPSGVANQKQTLSSFILSNGSKKPVEQMKVGDCIWLTPAQTGGNYGHAGMFMGVDGDGNYLIAECCSSKGSTITKIPANQWKNKMWAGGTVWSPSYT